MIEWAQAAALALCSTPLPGAGYAGFFSWRGRRRNADGVCAHFAAPQYAAPAYDPPAVAGVQYVGVFGGAVACMKRRNRAAVRLLGDAATAGNLGPPDERAIVPSG